MSTNHTTNYNLNQWEATDKVLRTDFNADNAKIDAALKANADAIAAETAARTAAVSSKADAATVAALSQTVSGKADQADVDALTAKAGTQLIQQVTLSAPEEWVDLDLSGIDWDQWATVSVCFWPVMEPNDDYRISCNSSSVYPLGSEVTREFQLLLLPCFSESSPVRGMFWPARAGSNMLDLTLTYAELDHIEFGGADGLFQSGSRFEVWGTK